MDCHYYKERLTLLLSNSLNSSERKELEKHLSNCPDCQLEFEVSQRIWNLMGEMPMPEPSPNMRAGFNAILNNFKEEHATNQNSLHVWLNKIQEHWHFRVRPRFAFGLVMVMIGLVTGYLLNRPNEAAVTYHRQIDSLSSQVSEMKQVMMLSLLQDPSASQRMLAVGYTDEISSVNNKVVDALLTTLNEDPNVNVRLITLEALVKFSNEPRVREGLVQSITKQDSPLLQSAIADVMVKLQEKRSVKSMQKLLRKKDLNQMVKTKIEQSIQKLI
jgi:hypothetical protein